METKQTKLFLSVVIPAYNEAENLAATVCELQEVIHQCPEVAQYEILVIDDHSTDNTFELVKSWKNSKIHCLRLSRRSGSHAAIRAGLIRAQGDAAFCISADGQDDPAALQQMLRKLERGAQLVWAIRRKREEPWLRKFLAVAAYRLINWSVRSSGGESDLLGADFYAMSRKVVDAINRCPEQHTSLFGLLLWLGFRQDFIEYDRRPRRHGRSKWGFTSQFRLLVDWIVAFSGVPLKVISLLGMLTAVLGFLYAIFVVIYTLLGYAKPGWAEMVTLILVLGGAQMMMLGVIGEYLWRTLDETRNRPLYFIEDETGE